MTTYRVTLDVQSRMLPTLLSTIDGNADIRLIAVTDAQEPALPPSPLPSILQPNSGNGTPRPRYVGGKKIKDIRGDDLVIETLRSGPATLDELKRAFEHHKFSPNSAPAYVSRMLRDGRITRQSHGRYALVKA